jgi:hypothetical protein
MAEYKTADGHTMYAQVLDKNTKQLSRAHASFGDSNSSSSSREWTSFTLGNSHGKIIACNEAFYMGYPLVSSLLAASPALSLQDTADAIQSKLEELGYPTTDMSPPFALEIQF